MRFIISIFAFSAALASATEMASILDDASPAPAGASPTPVQQICSDFIDRCKQNGDQCSTFCQNAETKELISIYEKFCLKVGEEWTCSGQQPNPGT
ncbi:hypothetical protein COCC4DRAFT_65556 [Bipolaris maydis ATCC 48331]|uniref:Extracellular membrane protein CFEM domain-containing protein n=2 Tax=Cochliobolus heterostrophus TaxID=5016 RepID=M2TL38_COCH5|nr:uncharacterized protein COCC4DRAFT_65556 [Bipolaris maydis ATCC 48331]EMD87204.1 hypothetical protein COCHEDRAFT_1159521 [Bipolaris maydis C5]KAH7555131.1 hypothetical protein BM1_07792 [Bipolaris maydis]ENI00401.1 hypothetical protein COCC4DRAFT_65556 [Bipolaris maydis ATCC 48331]KAJ5022964.1 hypothetical protein J3E73DRAFT_12841 [Bipolaris maydis]KAJ5056292.1 hypothetical protein J3E74DRAFT_17370 [Bipolaris maydis]